MIEFEEINEEETKGPGRPPMGRTQELYEALIEANERAKETNKYGFSVRLAEDEQGKFYRFTQRCRSAAKKAGIKVSISDPKDGKRGNIRICTE